MDLSSSASIHRGSKTTKREQKSNSASNSGSNNGSYYGAHKPKTKKSKNNITDEVLKTIIEYLRKAKDMYQQMKDSINTRYQSLNLTTASNQQTKILLDGYMVAMSKIISDLEQIKHDYRTELLDDKTRIKYLEKTIRKIVMAEESFEYFKSN